MTRERAIDEAVRAICLRHHRKPYQLFAEVQLSARAASPYLLTARVIRDEFRKLMAQGAPVAA